MGRNDTKRIEVRATEDELEQAQEFVESLLDNPSINSEIASETEVIFEAVFSLILMQGFSSDTIIDISGEKKLGGLSLKIGFDGKRFNLADDGEGGTSPEMRILEGFAEKVSHSYHRGYNVIRIAVKSTPRAFLISCGGGFLIAIATYLIISSFMDAEAQHALREEFVFPVEMLFGNALLMVGPPVTMLSILKNVSDVFIASERSADSHRLWRKSIATSLFAIGLAIAVTYVMSILLSSWKGYYAEHTEEVVDYSFSSLIVSMVPASIFEPFETISPVPLVLLAVIVTYALCHASVYFDKLKTAIDAMYELFSWMLRAVMVVLPFFCFIAFLDALLDVGFESLLFITRVVLSIAGGVLILLTSYAVRLRIKGIEVIPFVKKLLPLLRENIAINSAIDAVPYNIRYCARHYGMSRERLSNNLPVLAQLSLDGNTFILMYIAMIGVFMIGSDIHWVHILAIGLLVLFLELGAPNQPGGILVGTLIIITYLNLPDMLRMAIYLEVFFGSAQNIVNVISNIVEMAEDEGVHYDE